MVAKGAFRDCGCSEKLKQCVPTGVKNVAVNKTGVTVAASAPCTASKHLLTYNAAHKHSTLYHIANTTVRRVYTLISLVRVIYEFHINSPKKNPTKEMSES